MAVESFIITLDNKNNVPFREMVAHIRVAVAHWGGGYHPDDPLFEKLEVKSVKRYDPTKAL